MSVPSTTRRGFLGSASALIAAGALGLPSRTLAAASTPQDPFISCNVYPWMTFFQRRGRDWSEDLDASLAEFALSGLPGFEPSVDSVAEIERLGPLLRKHGLRMESIYVSSVLHHAEEAEESIARVLDIAEAASSHGARIVVTNPDPLGGQGDKNDEQLRTQARHLDRLGAELRLRSLSLAYHNHAPEMRRAAREYHHMMLATDPEHVGLCLEPHWIYRGAGDSQVALFDVIRLHGGRTVEIHLRQSHGGVWTETFGPGDIDYLRLAQELEGMEVRPLLVLEQAVESASPDTMDAVSAHRRSLDYVREVFATGRGEPEADMPSKPPDQG